MEENKCSFPSASSSSTLISATLSSPSSPSVPQSSPISLSSSLASTTKSSDSANLTTTTTITTSTSVPSVTPIIPTTVASSPQQLPTTVPTLSQKRPMNAFLIFCKRHRSAVKQKYPHLENRRITKILGEWWTALDSEAKRKYTDLARSYKEAFMKANPNFKWYKTDIKIPPVYKPSSPPQVIPLTPTAPQSGQISENVNLEIPRTSSQSSNSSDSTPKPPKKRYLKDFENGEFKGFTKSTVPSTSTKTNTTTVHPTPSGPPVLDIDTMNRVIENALGGGSGSNSVSPSSNSRNQFLIRNSWETNNDSIMNIDRSMPSTSTNSSTNSSNSLSLSSSSSNSTKVNETPNSPAEERPLDYSASKVLHTSNQQIIDHFIDKWLGTSATDMLSASLSLNQSIFGFNQNALIVNSTD